jgi:D-alanine--poly(phosphoribitol) ligase subunit 2
MYGEGYVEDDEQLFESGIIDSMGFVKLLLYIEETFDVPMDISEFTVESGTVNGIMALINSKIEMN